MGRCALHQCYSSLPMYLRMCSSLPLLSLSSPPLLFPPFLSCRQLNWRSSSLFPMGLSPWQSLVPMPMSLRLTRSSLCQSPTAHRHPSSHHSQGLPCDTLGNLSPNPLTFDIRVYVKHHAFATSSVLYIHCTKVCSDVRAYVHVGHTQVKGLCANGVLSECAWLWLVVLPVCLPV